MSATNIKYSAILITFVALYFFASSPGKVAVNSQGEATGIFNGIRALIQGNRFWENQVIEVKSELDWISKAPERRARLERLGHDISTDHNARMEELYNKYPNMRPTQLEVQADALREEADRLEQLELERKLEEYRQKRADKLRVILPIVEANAKK